MKQNTPEWIEMRKRCVGASDAPIIMEESPYGTPYQLWEEKMGIRVKEQHAGMKYGHEMEPLARKILEDQLMCYLEPQVLFHPENSWMMASLDALNVPAGIAAEIKNPNEIDHEMAKSGVIPPKYVAQLQHQLEILFVSFGINELYYFSHRKGDTALLSVSRNKSYIITMVEKEYQFWTGLKNLTPPKLCSRDYFELNDEQSIDNASELISINNQMTSLKQREEVLRKSLIEKTNGRNCTCNGLKLTKVISKGQVDYKAIPCIKDVDLEQYRKKPVESWRLTI